MTRFQEVPMAAPPTEFNDLEEGIYTLNAPFFTGKGSDQLALQVGLQPDEYEQDQKEPLAITVTGDLGHHAIELARVDGRPFTVESSEEDFRVPVLTRAVARLVVAETDGTWLEIGADDSDEPLDADPAGIGYLANILALYVHRKQIAEAERTPVEQR